MIKWLFRWAFRLFLLLVVLLVAGVLLLDPIARSVAEDRIRAETGMDVKIGSLSIGLLSPVLTVENFKLYNTAEFGGSPFIEMPELHLEYDRGALFSRRLHCRLVRINVAEVNVVLNKNGKTNLEAIEDWRRKIESPAPAGKSVARTQTSFFAGIETLNLTAGRATRLSMTRPDQVQEIRLDIHNQIVTNIKTEADLESMLTAVCLSRGGTPLLDIFSKNSRPAR